MTYPPYTIRAGENADWPALGEAVSGIQDFERDIVGYPLRPGHEIREGYVSDLRARLAASNGVFLVAGAAGEIIGVLAGYVHEAGDRLVAPEFDRSAYVSDLFVKSGWRRRGLGMALLRAFEQTMRARGSRWMSVCVKSRNRAAREAYLSYGFDEYETILTKRIEEKQP